MSLKKIQEKKKKEKKKMDVKTSERLEIRARTIAREEEIPQAVMQLLEKLETGYKLERVVDDILSRWKKKSKGINHITNAVGDDGLQGDIDHLLYYHGRWFVIEDKNYPSGWTFTKKSFKDEVVARFENAEKRFPEMMDDGYQRVVIFCGVKDNERLEKMLKKEDIIAIHTHKALTGDEKKDAPVVKFIEDSLEDICKSEHNLTRRYKMDEKYRRRLRKIDDHDYLERPEFAKGLEMQKKELEDDVDE